VSFNAIDVLLVLLVVQSLLFAIFLLSTPRGQPLGNRLLAGVLFAFATLFLVVFGRDHGWETSVAGLDLVAGFALGPLIDLHSRSRCVDGFRLSLGHILLFVPAAVGPALGRRLPAAAVHTLLFLTLLTFLARAIVRQRALRPRLARRKRAGGARGLGWLDLSSWLLASVVGLGILQHYSEQIASPAVADGLTFATLAAFGAFLVAFFFQALNHPTLLDALASNGSGANAANHLEADKLARVQSVLIARMTESGLFRDSALQLADLAQAAGFAESDVSEAIRRGLGDNFFDFVNRYRVESARRALVETECSITDAMLDSGFATKSSFYAEFRRRTGHPPGAYRQRFRAD
jgi:AraC-like DNA-binding protein